MLQPRKLGSGGCHDEMVAYKHGQSDLTLWVANGTTGHQNVEAAMAPDHASPASRNFGVAKYLTWLVAIKGYCQIQPTACSDVVMEFVCPAIATPAELVSS